MRHKFFRKTDLITVGVLVAFCLAYWACYLFFFSGKPAKGEIYYKSELVETVDLSKGVDRVFSVSGHESVVFHQFADGSVCFEQSDCPDKVCIHSGKLNKVGQTAACLPNEMILKIVSDQERSEGEPDIIVGK